MELLLGKPIVEEIKNNLIEKVKQYKRKPSLSILLNEKDLSSIGYVKAIVKAADEVGITVETIKLNTLQEYLEQIKLLNGDLNKDAVLLTRPLPLGVDEKEVIATLDYRKDVDGINPINLGKIFVGQEEIVPNTAAAIIKMLEYYHISLQGKKVLVIGRSLSVGKPVASMLLNRNATVTIAHSKTSNLNDELKNYDVIIGAVGKPHLIDGSLMKEGCVAIDAGIHYLETGIVGDIKPHENLKFISKVPGGIGPITTYCLLENVIKCFEDNYGK